MPVLLSPPYLQFFDANGLPLAGGKVYTYAAGTTTPKATYTDAGGLTPLDNPVTLDAAGRPALSNGSIWIQGSYKIVVTDSAGVVIRTTDNVTSFTAATTASPSFFQSFSGTGSQTAFTLSQDLGTDENSIIVYLNKNLQSNITNGAFATDTDWTKGAGWTIGSGIATAAGAISTAISQTSPVAFVQGQAYSVTYTITRSAGGLIPSIGGTAGVERVLTGTYNEIIIAGSTQTTAFTGNAFTGTLDNVSINVASTAGFDPINPSAYTLNGTALTFAVAPPTGTNNIYVYAPTLAAGAASVSATAADASATAAGNSAAAAAGSAASAAGFSSAKNKWTFSSTTAMADPGTGLLRFNNATPASVTAIAIDDLSANAGNPDVSPWVLSWDDVTGPTVRGTLYIFKDETNFAFFQITGASTDNAGWTQLAVTYLTGNGTISDTNALYIGFAAAGAVAVTGGITALTGDVTASGSGSQTATIAAGAVTEAKQILADNTTNNASTTAHGYLKKLSNVATEFMNGQGAWATPAGAPATTTTTAAASADVTFASLNFTTNLGYDIYANNIQPATDNTDFLIKLSDDAVTYDAPNYGRGGSHDNGSGVTNIATGIVFTGQDNGTTNKGTLVAQLRQPLVTGDAYVQYSGTFQNNSSIAIGVTGMLVWTYVAAVTGIRFIQSSGNLTLGTFILVPIPR